MSALALLIRYAVILGLAGSLGLGSLRSSLAAAHDLKNAGEVQRQIRLTPAVVKTFIATYKDMRQLQPVGAEEGAAPNAPERLAKMQAVLNKHAIASLDAWGDMVHTIMLAYSYADPESGLADLETNIQKSIAELKTDKDLSEDERKEAISNLEEEYKNIARQKPLPGNVDVVKPFVSAIKDVVEGE